MANLVSIQISTAARLDADFSRSAPLVQTPPVVADTQRNAQSLIPPAFSLCLFLLRPHSRTEEEA